MRVHMFHNRFQGNIHAGGLFVVLPGRIQNPAFLTVKGLFKERMAHHVSAAPDDLTVKHQRVDGLAGIIPVGGSQQCYLSGFFIHLELDGGGDKIQTVDQISLAGLPVNEVDVRGGPVALAVKGGSLFIIGLSDRQDKIDTLFGVVFDKDTLVLECQTICFHVHELGSNIGQLLF